MLDELAPRLRRAVVEPEWGARHGRRQLESLVRVVQAACLFRDGEAAAAELLVRRRLPAAGWPPAADDDSYAALIEAVLARDTEQTT